ncbi:lim domain, putative [Entamoeba dispar SAW760]|uniref:Lim domain, putative n=1 Tax=Entamoeba dispar (strain ATCC PRA-260 / SAW760) TaxID=370354 RepID=B0ENM9_ENTDS|nr:lim domain, putative [Entamoeba dispar SAW760]EDR23856.1 lim domain, putative [Entamoeba dispar SAW760]|eukprot:EDR23856.1 lim domain, putative [Entamoeba dispar SAW760]
MQQHLISNTLQNEIPMYPETISEYVEQLKKFKEFIESYHKRVLEPLGFYNMMLRTKQQKYTIPEYEIDTIIPNFVIISDLYEDMLSSVNDCIDLTRSTQIEMQEKEVDACMGIVTNELIDSYNGLIKRFSRGYTQFAVDYPYALTKHSFMLKYNSQYNQQCLKIQKSSEALNYGLEQLLEGVLEYPNDLLIALKALFNSITVKYPRWFEFYDMIQVIETLHKKVEDTKKNLKDHLIVAQTKIDINFPGGVSTEEIYDENRRLVKYVDGIVEDLQTFDYDGTELIQTVFEPKESREVRFYIFNDTLFMTTQPKRSIFSIMAHTALKGIIFKKRFVLTQCSVREKSDNRETNKYRCDIVEDTPQKTFVTVEFEDDATLQIFIQNLVSAKLEFAKTQCFGVTPKDFLSKVKQEKGRLIPRFFSYCTSVAISRGINEEGIFRISSEQKNITRLISRIDNGEWNFEIVNPHDAANLIKTYLRTLPVSIAGDKLDEFMDALEEPAPSEAIKKVFETMPECNVAMMYVFALVLKAVEAKKEVNKMGIDNLCIVVAPTFFWKKGEIQRQNGFEIVQYMVNHFEVFDAIRQRVDEELKKDEERIKKDEERAKDRREFVFGKASEEEKKRKKIEDEIPTMTVDEFKKAKLLEILEKERKEKEEYKERKRLEREQKEKEEAEKRRLQEEEMEKERLEAIERQKEIDRLEEEETKAKIEREKKRAEIEREMAEMEKKEKQRQLEEEKRIKEEELKRIENEIKRKEEELKKQEEVRKNVAQIIGTCCVCNSNVLDTEDSLNAGKRLVHERCFVCKVCKEKISGKFAWRENGFICGNCVSKENNSSQSTGSSNLCGKCGKPVEGKILKAMGKVWHHECFICAKCGGKISGGFVNWDGKPVCKNCKDSI